LVDKKITDASEIIRILDSAVKEDYPLLIVAEDVEEKAMADLIKNKLKGTIKVAAVKAFSFGEQKTQCLDDIAVMTGGTTVNHQLKVPNQCNPSHQHILFGFQVQ
jgi:chaperonin GroEL